MCPSIRAVRARKTVAAGSMPYNIGPIGTMGPRDPIPAAPNHNTLAVASSESLQLISSPQSDENWPCREYRPHAFNPPPYVTSSQSPGRLLDYMACATNPGSWSLMSVRRAGFPLDVLPSWPPTRRRHRRHPKQHLPRALRKQPPYSVDASADHPPRGLWVVLPHRRLPPDYTPATLPH
jgi:hypothetical protein